MTPKNYLQRMAALFVCLFIFTAIHAQSTTKQEKIYSLEFGQMDQQMVKPLIAKLMPLFGQVPFFVQDTYEVMYYKYDGELKSSDVQALIENSLYELKDVKELEAKIYNKLVDKSLNPKN